MHQKLEAVCKIYDDNRLKIDKALEPFGVTFQELFMARHSQITDIGFEIQRKEVDAMSLNCDYDERKKLYAEIKRLTEKRDVLIYGRLIEE